MTLTEQKRRGEAGKMHPSSFWHSHNAPTIKCTLALTGFRDNIVMPNSFYLLSNML